MGKPSLERVKLARIEPFRALFLHESNTQIRYDAYHERGWTDSYLLSNDGVPVGYGSVKGRDVEHRDTIFEFYVIPSHRSSARDFFRELLRASAATVIECQSNDLPLAALA